jgi:flagellar FliL protein
MAAEDDLDLDVETAKKSGGSKMIIIIAVVVVLVLALSGLATYLLLGNDSAPAMDVDDASPPSSEPAPTPKGPMSYLPLSPAFVVNFAGDSDIRFLQLDLQLGSRDAGVLEQVREHSPAIRNELVILFSSQDPEVLNTREGKEQLRQDTLAAVRRVLRQEAGMDGVDNVYFTSFVMQ